MMRRNLRLSLMLGATPVEPFNPKERAAALEQARVAWGEACQEWANSNTMLLIPIRRGFNGVYGYPDTGDEYDDNEVRF